MAFFTLHSMQIPFRFCVKPFVVPDIGMFARNGEGELFIECQFLGNYLKYPSAFGAAQSFARKIFAYIVYVIGDIVCAIRGDIRFLLVPRESP